VQLVTTEDPLNGYMNILFVNTSRIWGGNEKWTHMASHALASRHNVLLVYRCPYLGSRFSIKKMKLPFINRVDLFTLYCLKKIIQREHIDILISTNRKHYLLGVLASKITGCRHFVRCGIVWNVPDNIYNRFLFREIDGIIVNARAIQDMLIKSGVVRKDKIHVVYNGLDTDILDKSKLKYKSRDEFVIISSGELVPRKGYIFLLHAFAKFIKMQPDSNVQLILIGKGRQEQELKSVAKKLGIEQQVTFAGFLDDPYSLIIQSNLFVSVSQNEGISNALLEAMYLGIPVVTTPAGGSLEVISHGENGFLIKNSSEKYLADIFRQAYLNSSLFQDIGRAGQSTVKSKFSLASMSSHLENIFKSYLGRKKT